MATGTPATVLQLRSSAGMYGADRVVLALDGALRNEGARSALLCIRNYLLDAQPLHQAAVAAGSDAMLLPCRGRIDMRTVDALVALVDARGADMLHVHDYKSAFYAWLAARRRPGVKLVATLHGWVESSRALRLYTTLELALLRRFDALAVVSRPQVERLLRAGVPRDRIHQVDNGIAMPAPAPERPGLRRALGLAGPGPVLAAVARLSPEKNLAQLVSAFAAASAASPGACLLVVGDGPDREALQALAGASGAAHRIVFAGRRDDMDDIYRIVDALVLPSLSEGMPLVVLEAMSHGVPVIASAVGEVPRLLAGTEHGVLLPPGDGAQLQAALRLAIARPPGHDARAVETVRTHYSTAAMAARYLDLYHSLREQDHDRRSA
ncbi:glycosyltransferase family 4 protein [Luteimonas lutimaris]|uniref:Glycosyltransferase n=1 Tax=Luteimonas lutimaris TaxID=698645 RepID=A0ABP7MHH3_9GAMM